MRRAMRAKVRAWNLKFERIRKTFTAQIFRELGVKLREKIVRKFRVFFLTIARSKAEKKTEIKAAEPRSCHVVAFSRGASFPQDAAFSKSKFR